MYNEELKLEYIREKQKEVILPNAYLKCRFEESQFFEESLQKDLYDFTTDEIIEYYKMLGYSSFESLISLNSQLNLYVQWCSQKNLIRDNQNHFLEINKEILINCVNKTLAERKIVDRDTVLKWADQLQNPKDEFVLLALFEFGKSRDFADILNAKLTDISEADHTMKLSSGRTVKISQKLIDYALEAEKEELYYPVLDDSRVKKIRLIDNGCIIKDYVNCRSDSSLFRKGRRIYNATRRIFHYLGVPWMTPNALVESGKIYMIQQRAAALGITPKEFIHSEHIKEIEEQYNCKIKLASYETKYNDYL